MRKETKARQLAYRYFQIHKEAESLQKEMELIEAQLRAEFPDLYTVFLEEDVKVYFQPGRALTEIDVNVVHELSTEEIKKVATISASKLTEIRKDLVEKYLIEKGTSKSSLRVSKLTREDRERAALDGKK